jgi:hypothetical protein
MGGQLLYLGEYALCQLASGGAHFAGGDLS